MSWARFKRLSSKKDLTRYRRDTTFDGGGGGGGGNDPDAQAYIDALDAAGYTISGTEEAAINDLVLALKTANIYSVNWAGYTPSSATSIIDLLYLFMGSSALPAAVNLADPRDLDAAYRASFVGGWTFTGNGAQGDGISNYGRTHLTDALLSSTTERWFGAGSLTDSNPGASVEIGKGTSLIQRLQLRSAGSLRVELYSSQQTAATADSLGNVVAYRRTGGNEVVAYKEAAKLIDNGSATGTLSLLNEYFFGASNNTDAPVLSPNFRSSRVLTHVIIGRNRLDASKATAFNAALAAFNTAIGR